MHLNKKTGQLIWAKNYKVPFRSNLKIIDNKLITQAKIMICIFLIKKMET